MCVYIYIYRYINLICSNNSNNSNHNSSSSSSSCSSSSIRSISIRSCSEGDEPRALSARHPVEDAADAPPPIYCDSTSYMMVS